MKKIKRWMSALLALCMLTVALPVPVLAETTGTPVEGAAGAPISEPTAAPTAVATSAAEEEQTDASPQQTDDPEAAVATAVPTPVPTDEATGTPTPVPTDEATGTPAPVPTDEAIGTPAPVPTDEAAGTPAPVPTDEVTGTPAPAPTDETTGTPAPVPTDETAGTPAPVPTDEATGTPAPVPTDETAGTPTPVPTDEATGTPTPIPTDAAEVKTIISFEAIAPEGLSVPQGTLEADLGLPASLSVQFTGGAAGEVPVTWQCAAGYDPNAEAGTQFAFAAVLPEGYALAEGVSLPQILVTLTPPLANAMPAAQASGEGWTYDEATGTLTITGDCSSADIPVIGQAQWIDVAPKVAFTNSASVTLSCVIWLNDGDVGGLTQLINYGTISGAIVYGRTYTLFVNETGGVISGGSSVSDCIVNNGGLISGGYFSDCSIDCVGGTVTGGNFQRSTFNNVYGSSITGGEFANFTMDPATMTLTITGTADLSSMHPLTLSIQELTSITVGRDATLAGGTFIDTPPVTIEYGGAFTGGVFENFSLDSASQTLTVTGTVDLSSLAPLTVGVNSVKKIVIKDGGNVTGGAFNADTEWDIQEGGLLTGGSFGNFSWDPVNRGLTIIGEMDLDEEGAFEPFDIGMDSIASIYIADNGNLIGGTIPAGINVSVARYGKISNATITIKEGASLDCIGLITGGTFYGDGQVYVHLFGEITGGTFNCNLFLEPHYTASNAYINGGISGYGVYEPSCIFGEGAHFGMHFGGYIQQYVDADGEQKIINYGANVRQALGTPPEGLDWALQAEDGHLTLVGEYDTMPLLRNGETRTYVLVDPTTFISNMTIEEIPAQTYTGEPITPAVTITTSDGELLVADTDYTVEYKDNVNAGTATVTITGKGIYTGSVDVPFQINKAKAPEIIWPTTAGSITYGEILRDSTLTSADTHGTFAWDLDVRYTQLSPGTYTYDVTYMPNSNNYDYTGVTMTRPFSVTVTKKDIADEIFVLIIQRERSYPYTGEPIEPQWEVMYLLSEKYYLTMGEDYTVAYSGNINAGTATATYTGIGDYYTGTRTVEFTIQPQAAALNVSSTERTWAAGMSLDESDLRALFTVNDAGGTALSNDKYTIAVTQNGAEVALPIVNAGEYTVKVTLKDTNYSLSNDSFPYTIARLPFSGAVNMSGYAYGGAVSQPALSGYAGDGTVTYYYKAQDAAGWTEWTNIGADTLTPGDYEIKAVVADATNYAGGQTAPVEFTVAPGKLAASIAMQDYTYGGTVSTPTLESAVTGLSIAWYYKGADGVEHSWENITGTTLTAGGYTIIARTQATALYEAAEFTATFTVEKASAPAIQWPTAQGITYGQAVSEAALSATADAYGTFAWEQPNAILNAGEQTATLVYTPRDTANYDYDGVELEKAIAISVSAKSIEGENFIIEPIPDQTYTGAEIEPEIVVKDGDTVLTEGEDYEVSYEGNTDTGEATATITGTGNYSGELETTFEIVQKDISEESTSLTIEPIPDQVYTGEEIEPEIVVKDSGKVLTEGEDYEVSYTDNTVAGTATVTVNGKGNYTGEMETTFEIVEKDISEEGAGLTIDPIPDQTYTGAEIEPEIVVKDGGKVLTEGVDYEVSYEDNTDAGEATVTITGTGNYSGELETTFEIVQKEITEDGGFTIDPIPEQTYTSAEIEPDVAVKDGGKTLEKDKDYTVEYADNIDVGEATAAITGTGNYSGSLAVKFQITAQAAALNVLSAERTWSKDMSLDESDLRALFTVNDATGKALDGGLYTITVTKDGATAGLPIEDAGAYTIKVTLTTGNYALAEDSFTYTIAKLPFTGTVSMAGYVYEGTASQPVLNGYDGDGEVTFLYRAEGGDAWQEWPESITGVSLVPGNYEIKASVAATQNYAGGETAASFTISPAKLGVSIEMPDYTYGGTVPAPALTPETSGLTVAWFYKGADGEKHPWENITGTTLTAGGYTIIARVEASALYEAAELTSTFTVNKAAAPEIDWPEVTQGITYGQALSAATLSATEDAYGTFAWQNPDAILSAGEQTATLVYTPRDTANYDYSTAVLTRVLTVSVATKPLDDEDIAIDPIPDQPYTGGEITPEIVVKDGDEVLTEGEDYEVSYEENTDAGTATVTVTGKGNYTGEMEATFEIIQKEITEDEGFTIDPIPDQTYTGEEIKPEIVVKDGDKVLVEGEDYEVSYEENIETGEATVTITGTGNYTGEAEVTFEIVEKDISEEGAGLTIDPIPDQTYTGEEIKPEIVVKDGDKVLVEGEDYEVTYGENTDAGEATVTITGKGNYAGETEVTFEIIQKDITEDEGFTIDPIPEQVYTGEEIKPEIVVKDGDKVLVEGEDYEVTYEENTDAGEATVTITGKGNYTGETEVTFEIVKAAAPAIQWPEVTGSITYGQTVAEIVLSAMEDANGTFAWKCPDYVPDAGAQLIALIYTPSDTANYDYTGVPTICEMRVEVAPKDISGMTVDAISAQTETGKALTPAVTVRDGDTVLTAGADYTVAYANNIKPGTATATITGVGNYAGMLTATFTIREAEKDDEDENDESTVETLTPAQQAENLTAGEAVDGIVTDRNGETMPYVPSTGEVTDEETQEVLQRTLVIAAEPLLDEDGQPVLRDGQPVYEQRNLNLSRGLLDALTELGYTHIRFVVKDAALEWLIAEMTEDGYVVRLAPMEADELSQAETEAIGETEALTSSYRARITAMIEGEETDVTNAIPSLTAIFDAASVRELAEGETAQLLLVPNDGEPEAQVSTVQFIEATETEPARYEALLMESGLFVMTLQ